MQNKTSIPALAGNGWKEQESKIILVWFLTSQLPPCLSRKSNRVEDGYNAGSEENDNWERWVLKHFEPFCFISTLFQYIFNI